MASSSGCRTALGWLGRGGTRQWPFRHSQSPARMACGEGQKAVHHRLLHTTCTVKEAQVKPAAKAGANLGEARRPSWGRIEQNAVVRQGVKPTWDGKGRAIGHYCLWRVFPKCRRAQALHPARAFPGSVLPTRKTDGPDGEARHCGLFSCRSFISTLSKNNTQQRPTAPRDIVSFACFGPSRPLRPTGAAAEGACRHLPPPRPPLSRPRARSKPAVRDCEVLSPKPTFSDKSWDVPGLRRARRLLATPLVLRRRRGDRGA